MSASTEITRNIIVHEREDVEIFPKKREDVKIAIPPHHRKQLVEFLTENEKRKRHSELYRAALKGDWEIAKDIFDKYPDDILAKISKEGDTALHIAAALERSTFGIKLVEEKHNAALVMKNNAGNTALCIAAASGNVELAKVMLKEDKYLAFIRGEEAKLPLYKAALNGRRKMVEHLYKVTTAPLSSEDAIKLYRMNEAPLTAEDLVELLTALIKSSLFDIALQLVQEYPETATKSDKNKSTALHLLAQMPLKAQQGFWWRVYRYVFGYEEMKMPPQALKLVELLWEKVTLLCGSDIPEIIRKPSSLIFAAAKQGNIEFLNIIFYDFPDLIFEVDENHYSIFHFAVKYRHINIFRIVHEIGSSKDLLIQRADKEGNTILHLAASLPPPDRRNTESGALFQLMVDIAWFKKVSGILHPSIAEAKNSKGETARDIFTEQHKELKQKGERWIKDSVSSSLVAATIVATMTFAAVFQVPGGTKEDTGAANLGEDSSFKSFVGGDSVSLLLSTCSILIFLSIYHSRFQEKDFLVSLPLRLAFGFFALYYSVLAMLSAFCETISILFKDGKQVSSTPVYISVIAYTILIVFAILQIPFFFKVIFSHRILYEFQSSREGTLFRIPNKKKRKAEGWGFGGLWWGCCL